MEPLRQIVDRMRRDHDARRARVDSVLLEIHTRLKVVELDMETIAEKVDAHVLLTHKDAHKGN